MDRILVPREPTKDETGHPREFWTQSCYYFTLQQRSSKRLRGQVAKEFQIRSRPDLRPERSCLSLRHSGKGTCSGNVKVTRFNNLKKFARETKSLNDGRGKLLVDLEGRAHAALTIRDDRNARMKSMFVSGVEWGKQQATPGPSEGQGESTT